MVLTVQTQPVTPPDSRESRAPGRVLKNVQALRFVAAAMVLVDHMQYEIVSRPYLSHQPFTPSRALFWAGGVDIFFVISGFIMYTIGSPLFGQPSAWRHFIVRRVIRVVPPYWVVTTLMIASVLFLKDRVNHNTLTALGVIGSYLFIPVRNAYGTYYPVLSLGWTLNFEMFFYGLFAIALTMKRGFGMTFLIVVLLTLGGIGLAGGVQLPLIGFWCNSIVMEFLFGIILGWSFSSGRRLNRFAGVLLFCVGAALIALASYMKYDVDALQYRAIWMGIPALMMCLGLIFIEDSSPPNPLLRAVIFGGNISFAVYLCHPFLMNFTAVVFEKLHVQQPFAFLAAATVAIFGGASIFYLAFEKPVSRWLENRILGKRHPQPVNASFTG